MNYKIYVYVENLEKVNRTIIVNDDITLDLLIKCSLLILNASPINLCAEVKNDECYLYDKKQLNKKLKDLKFKENDIYKILYDYTNYQWKLNFKILEIKEGLNKEEYKAIDGNWYGILKRSYPSIVESTIEDYKKLKKKHTQFRVSYTNKMEEYINYKFSQEETEEKIRNYMNIYKDNQLEKNIVMNVSLEGFNSSIKRKIVVNNNILIDQFCRGIIKSMRGNMDHMYTIKVNKEMYDEDILDHELRFLDLEVGSKFKIVYDYGDNWEFSVKVSKINEGYNTSSFTVLDGRGFGIIEDCGGSRRLKNYFDTKGKDINDFDLEKIQNRINSELKIKNLHQKRVNAGYY